MRSALFQVYREDENDSPINWVIRKTWVGVILGLLGACSFLVFPDDSCAPVKRIPQMLRSTTVQ